VSKVNIRRVLLAGLVVACGGVVTVVLWPDGESRTRADRKIALRPVEGSDQPEPSTWPRVGNLFVRVVDKVRNRPIAGASCVVRLGDADHAVAKDTTGLEGSVQFRGLPRAERVRLVIDSPGYESVTTDVTLESGLTSIDVLLEGAAAIRGSVRDEQGTPVKGVRVYVDGGAHPSWQTDQQGRFALSAVPKTSHVQVSFIKTGYAPHVVDWVPASDASLDVTLARTTMLRTLLHFPGLSNSVAVSVRGVLRSDRRVVYSGALHVEGDRCRQDAPYADDTTVYATVQLSDGARMQAHAKVEFDSETGHTARITFGDVSELPFVFVDPKGHPLRTTSVNYRVRAAGDTVHGTLFTDANGRASLITGGRASGAASAEFVSPAGVSRSVTLGPQLGEEERTVQLAMDGGGIVVDLGTHAEDPDAADGLSVREAEFGDLEFPRGSPTPGTIRFVLPTGFYRVVWRGNPIAEDEIEVKLNEQAIVRLDDQLGKGTITSQAPPDSEATLWMVGPRDKQRVACTRPDGEGHFGFHSILQGHYLVDVEFRGGAHLAREVLVRPGALVEVPPFDDRLLDYREVRIVDANNAPLANRDVLFGAIPVRLHPAIRQKTDPNGMARIAFGQTEWLSLTIVGRGGFAFFRPEAPGVSQRIKVPPADPRYLLKVPPELAVTLVLWISQEGEATWFRELLLQEPGLYGLPRCEGRQYFKVNAAGGSFFAAAYVRPEDRTVVLAPNELFTLSRRSVPADAIHYELTCESLGRCDVRPYGWRRAERLPGEDLRIEIPPGSVYRLVLESGDREQKWEALLDANQAARQIELSK